MDRYKAYLLPAAAALVLLAYYVWRWTSGGGVEAPAQAPTAPATTPAERPASPGPEPTAPEPTMPTATEPRASAGG